MSDDLSARLAEYLARKLAASDLEILSLARIPGGASRETYRFRARYTAKGKRHERALILRRDPPASLIETERSVEYRAYDAFHKLGLPVPEPVALELDPEPLERPFFIMSEVENCTTGGIMNPDPYGGHREKIGRQFFTNLGRIARADPAAIGLSDFDGPKRLDDAWRHEVARWERVIDEDEVEPQPIMRAAVRWLKRNPPPPAQKLSVVHGDYRTGNFLFDDRGDMSHPGGMLPREEAIAIWERESGLKAQKDALFWWEIFASLKGAAIWISAAREYAEGRNIDPINAFSGWFCLAFHNRILAERLGALA